MEVQIGDLAPNQTAIIHWWMISSLEGIFKNYNATFENKNLLGDDRLSLLDELEIHELIRNVKLYNPVKPEDRLDDVLDFLINQRKDVNRVPDAIVDSRNLSFTPVFEGNVTSLTEVGRENVDEKGIKLIQYRIQSLANNTSAWNYFRFVDEDVQHLPLTITNVVNVTQGAHKLPVENAWIRRNSKGNPRRNFLSLHLFAFMDEQVSTFDVTVCIGGANCTVDESLAITALPLIDPGDIVDQVENATLSPVRPPRSGSSALAISYGAICILFGLEVIFS